MPVNTASSSCPSPPPSPSRNSIFDQSWVVEAGPNIASAYPKKPQSPIFVSVALSPSTPRHGVRMPSASDAQHAIMSPSPVSGFSSSPSLVPADPHRIERTSSHKHWKPSDMWSTTAAAAVAPPSTTSSSNMRRPSPSSSSTSAFSLRLVKSKSSFLGNGRHAEVYKGSVHRLSTAHGSDAMEPSLSSSKNPEAEHVHVSTTAADAQRAAPSLINSSIMTSLAPHTLLGRTPPQQQIQPHRTDVSLTTQDSEQLCAVKCLFPDDESQQVGWTEARLLQSLQSSESPHPGREHVVGLHGVYDVATQTGFPVDDNDSFVFHQARMDRISSPVSHSQVQPPSTIEAEPEWALLLEYCSQGSLWDWVQRHPEQVGLHLWLSWAIQLAQAVDFIHGQSLVHHDIKPHNIMLTSTLDAKLSDFGAGRRVEDPEMGLTDGLGRGTPPYSAPEIFHMNRTYSYPIDIYSLGVTLYVAGLTAQEPFSKLKSMVEMMVWVKKGGFWQWEEQGWIHDRGPVPKKTSLSQASVSSAAAAAAVSSASAHQVQSLAQLEARSGPYAQGSLWGSLSNSSLSSISSDSHYSTAAMGHHHHSHHHHLPPLNTHGLSVVAQQPTPGPPTSPMVASFPNSPQDALRPQPTSAPAIAQLGAPLFRSSTAPLSSSPPSSFQHPTTMSPPSSCPSSPLPQPMLPVIRHHQPPPRSRPASQQSLTELASATNGTVWRFLNGEPVDGTIIALLKAMCNPDPEQRPTAGQVVAQLEEIQDRLLRMQCE